MNTDDTIFALATAWAESALAIIRTSGTDAIALASTCFSRPKALLQAANGTLVHGYLLDPATGISLDEAVAAVYHQGHGYTGENAVEFTVHGSLPGLRKLLDMFSRNGFRPAEGGEFTLRAFMHGKLDLTQAEAVQELIGAQSAVAQSLALQRLGGALTQRIESLKQSVLDIVSFVEVQLDYAEDEIGGDTSFPTEKLMETVEGLEALSATWNAGRLYGHGAKVVLAGATNAGKSSLFNLLLKEERAIVSDVHGTTRDFIEASVELEGVPIRLFDTAGLRDALDTIEVEGIRRTEVLLEGADIILLLVDGASGQTLGSCDQKILHDTRTMVVWNKADLGGAVPANAYAVSSRTGEGVSALVHAMVGRLASAVQGSSDEQQVIIESQRQRDGLTHAAQSLRNALQLYQDGVPLDIVAMDLTDALQSLGELTGEVTSADVLNRIFSGFCVGK